jgi:hypothetical protein
MSYSNIGPYGFLPQLHNPPKIRNGVVVVPESELPFIRDATLAPEPKQPVDIDQDAEFISQTRNRSIVTSKNDSSSETPENIFRYDAKTSKALDERVNHFKSMFNTTLLEFGAPASLAYEQASAEVEAILFSKFGVELKIDSDVLDYANAIIDADVLTKLFASTDIDKDVIKATLSDFITKSFDSVRSSIKNRNRADVIARYKSKLQNLVAEEDKAFAVSRGRK